MTLWQHATALSRMGFSCWVEREDHDGGPLQFCMFDATCEWAESCPSLLARAIFPKTLKADVPRNRNCPSGKSRHSDKRINGVSFCGAEGGSEPVVTVPSLKLWQQPFLTPTNFLMADKVSCLIGP